MFDRERRRARHAFESTRAVRLGSGAAFRRRAGALEERLPRGAYYLLQGADRELLVPDARRRAKLWTTRVWPGPVLVSGEIAGTWRRAQARVTLEPWRRLARAERDAVEAEARSLPLPGVEGPIRVSWSG